MFGLFKSKDQKAADKSAKIRAQALENARAAREAIGDETLQKIAHALSEGQKSEGKRAQEKIRQMDKERVAEHLKSLLDER